jgi:hypothetical protein
MAFSVDRTRTDILVICNDCQGVWRRGPFSSEAAALAAAAAHARETHEGHKRLADQVVTTMRRRGQG